MFLVCPGCGEWSSERPVVESTVVCACACRHPISLSPLLLVTGASCSGKTTIALQLAGAFAEGVVLDSDLLWMPELNTPEDDCRRFRGLWLRLAANIAQGGRPLMLFGSCVPDDYERLPERRYIGPIHTLALVCDDDELRSRLMSRPSWRGSRHDDVVETMQRFNGSLRAIAERAPQTLTLVDTTCEQPDTSAARVRRWATRHLMQ